MTSTFTIGRAPGALPLVGHARQLLQHPVDFLGSLSAYGDLVEVRLGPQRAYVPCHPALLRQVLTDDRTFDKNGLLIDKARQAVGNGLATCPHRDHRRIRRLVQPAFGQTALEQYGPVMEQEAGTLAASWRPGQVIDAFDELSRLAVRIVARTLFSTGLDDRTADDLQRSFATLSGEIGRRMFVPEFLQRLPLPMNRRYEQSIRHFNSSVDRVIADCRTDGAAGGLVAALTGAPADGGAGLDAKETRDQVIAMLGAGTETAAATTAWTLFLLTQHPDLEQRLHTELDEVLAGRPARLGDLPDLPFTGHLITEALRLYPSIWLSMRLTSRPVELAGRHLPSGTTILYSPSALHQQAGLYEHPDRFDPDRWQPAPRTALPRGAFVPFGAGDPVAHS